MVGMPLTPLIGPLVRVGPNLVMFGDPDTYRHISGVRSSFFKGPFYQTAKVLPDTDSLFSMVDEEGRKELRAQLTPGVSHPTHISIYPTKANVILQVLR